MQLPDWWEPLQRESPQVDSSSPPGRVRFSCKLSGDPPDEWVAYFKDPQVETEFAPDNLQIVGSHGLNGFRVTGECVEEHLEKCVANIDGRIKEANRKFEQEVIPGILEDQRRMTEEKEAQDARVRQLQQRADEL